MAQLRQALLVGVAMFALVNCSAQKGDKGDPGPSGQPPLTGSIAGTVTDATLHDPLAGVAVTVKTTGGDVLNTATTDASGKYSLVAPIGTVAVAFQKDFFTSPGDLLVGVVAVTTVNANAALSEAASGRPSVALSGPTDVGYGATATVTAAASDPNGDALTYAWSNATVPLLGAVSGSGASATVTLPTIAQAFAFRLEGATAPNQYVSGYTIDDRFGMLPVTPDTRGEMSVKVVVADGRGQSASASLTLDAASVLTGTRNVAAGTRVYVNSGHDATNAWTLTAPAGSAAVLDDATARTPSFVADVQGAYTLAEGANTMTVNAGRWVGIVTGGSGNSITYDTSCATTCHDGATAPDKFTPWANTNHATKFARGINGLSGGTSYGASCIVCHTVGFDKGALNGGFDDLMAADGWTFPTPAAGNWDALVAKPEYGGMIRLSNIQCENCHGPQDSAAHHAAGAAGAWASPRISYSAEVCATCHASGTGHHFYSEWSTVDPNTGWGHSNRATARSVGATTSLNSSCGRCHTAQGYGEYAAQLAAGRPGTLLVTAGVTSANVEPVTCSACHDPHDATNPNQLRFFGDTPLLPAGFSMRGVGKGALCLTCHNSRNALQTGSNVLTYLHEDGETYNAGNPTGYSAPHQACQGDVFAGRNAYFLGASTPMTSRHAAVEDACVGCHMALNPQTHLSHGSPAVSSHVFRITDDNQAVLCANCHGSAVNGEGIQAQVEAGLTNLAVKMGNAVKAKVNAFPGGLVRVRAYDGATDFYSSTSASNLVLDVVANPVTSVAIEEIHGQIGFVLNFAQPITVPFVDGSGAPAPSKSMTSFGVQMGALKDNAATPAALFALSGNMVRAGWNYFLVEGDQSKGLHNPTFANAVLDASLAKDLSN